MGCVRATNLGRFECVAIKSFECFGIMYDMLQEDAWSLVEGGSP